MNKGRKPTGISTICLLILAIAAPLGLDLCLPGIPLMFKEENLPAGMTQWVISGFILSWSFSQLFFGPLLDRVGAKPVLLCGSIIYAFGAVSVYVIDSAVGLIVLRFVQGCGAGAMAVSVSASIPLCFRGAEVGKMFSLMNGVISLVPILAPSLGGILIVLFGWRSSFYFLAGFVALSGLLAGLQTLPGKPKEHQPKTAFSPFPLSGYLTIIQHPEFRMGCLASSCGFATQLIFFSSSPVVLIDTLSIPIERFGHYFAVNALAITFGSLLIARLQGRINNVAILYGGALMLVLAMCGYLITVHITSISVWPYLLSATLGSLGFAVLIATGAAMALSPFSTLAGQASALLAATQMSFASLIAWGVMYSWSHDWWSMIAAYGLLAAILLLQLQFYRANRTRRAMPNTPSPEKP